MSQKTPTDADREACAEEARGLVFDVLPGYWGEVYQKFQGSGVAIALRSFPHHEKGFVNVVSADHCAYANRRDDLDEEYLAHFQLNHDEIEWLHEQLSHHLQNCKVMATGINYKQGDQIRLKVDAYFPGLEDKICKASGDFYANTMKVEWETDKWCFAPAALFEKAD